MAESFNPTNSDSTTGPAPCPTNGHGKRATSGPLPPVPKRKNTTTSITVQGSGSPPPPAEFSLSGNADLDTSAASTSADAEQFIRNIVIPQAIETSKSACNEYFTNQQSSQSAPPTTNIVSAVRAPQSLEDIMRSYGNPISSIVRSAPPAPPPVTTSEIQGAYDPANPFSLSAAQLELFPIADRNLIESIARNRDYLNKIDIMSLNLGLALTAQSVNIESAALLAQKVHMLVATARKHSHVSLASATKQSLLAQQPGYNPQTAILLNKIDVAAALVGEEGGPNNITIATLNDAYILNGRVAKMYFPTPQNFRYSPFAITAGSGYTAGAGGIIPAGAGGVFPAGAGGVLPAGAGGVFPAGAGGVFPAGAGGVIPAGAGRVFPAGAGGLGGAVRYNHGLQIALDQCRRCGQRGHYQAQCPFAAMSPNPRFQPLPW